MSDVSVVILAAGGSRRMRGEVKQLARWNDRTLLQHVVDTAARSSASEIIIVLGRIAREVEESLDLPDRARTVVNEEFESGQALSLRVGLAACAPESSAALVLLGDQPGVPTKLVDDAISTWRGGNRPILRFVFADGPGHPVVLAREVWGRLDKDGDEGARALIRSHPQLVHDVLLDQESPADVDTPEDLRDLGQD